MIKKLLPVKKRHLIRIESKFSDELVLWHLCCLTPLCDIVHIFFGLIDDAKLVKMGYLFLNMLIASSNFSVDTNVDAFQKRSAADLLLQSCKMLSIRFISSTNEHAILWRKTITNGVASHLNPLGMMHISRVKSNVLYALFKNPDQLFLFSPSTMMEA